MKIKDRQCLRKKTSTQHKEERHIPVLSRTVQKNIWLTTTSTVKNCL